MLGRKLIIANILLMLLFASSILMLSGRPISLQQFPSSIYAVILLMQFLMFSALALSSLPFKVRYPLSAGLLFCQCYFLLNSLFTATLSQDTNLNATAILCIFLATTLVLIGGANWMRETRERAIGDKLTGLFNRRYFETAVEHFLNSQDRLNTPGCLLSLDINQQINPSHSMTQLSNVQLVALIAQVLKDTTRASDLVCRSGDEEFQALLVGSDISNAREVGERILQGVRNNADQKEKELNLSIGITSLIPSDDITSLRMRVEKAIDCAKQLGNTQVVTV